MSFITKQLESDVAKRLDDLLDFKKLVGGVAGNLLEMVDGKFFAFVITSIDGTYGSRISDLYKDAIVALLEAFAYEDYEKLTIDTVEIIDEMWDIPFIEDDLEAKFIYANLQVLKQIAMHLASDDPEDIE